MKKRMIQLVAGLFVACVLLGGGTVGAVAWSTHESVQKYCGMAQRTCPHPGDDVVALVEVMNSSAQSLRDRNHAVWALGRLSNAKALPALEAVYTGERCKHDQTLCQYELEKAIKRCGGTPNPPRITGH